MAERRMFARSVVCSDRFLDMPVSARELYFQLGMQTDDDGFVGNPRTVTRSCGASVDDMKVLAAKGFVTLFESGVLHITDFATCNTIRKDRYHETIYANEKRILNSGDNQAATIPQPGGTQPGGTWETEGKLVKDRVGEAKGEGETAKRTRFTPPTLSEVEAYCKERASPVNPQRFVDYYTANGWMAGRNHMKDWRAAVRNWESREKTERKASEYAADF